MGYVLSEIIIPLILALLLGVAIGWLLWGFRRSKVTYSEWETDTPLAASSSLAGTDSGHQVIDLRGELDTATTRIAELEHELAGVGSGVGGGGVSSFAAVAGTTAMGAREVALPYGEGSLVPLSDGSNPVGYPIKGNVDSMLYHRPDSRNYGATIAEVWFDTPDRAEAAGFGLARTHPKEPVPMLDPAKHPYGEGSLAPLPDGSSPGGYTIKGNADSMLYHRPDSRSYRATIAEVWFDTPDRAEAAGFRLASTHPKN